MKKCDFDGINCTYPMCVQDYSCSEQEASGDQITNDTPSAPIKLVKPSWAAYGPSKSHDGRYRWCGESPRSSHFADEWPDEGFATLEEARECTHRNTQETSGGDNANEVCSAPIAGHPDVEKPTPAGVGRKIYPCSKVHHAKMWLALQHYYPIHARWLTADPGESPSALSTLWIDAVSDIKSSSALICYCEDRDELKGAAVEVGIALACGIPVYIAGKTEALKTAQFHPLVKRWASENLLDALQDLKNRLLSTPAKQSESGSVPRSQLTALAKPMENTQ